MLRYLSYDQFFVDLRELAPDCDGPVAEDLEQIRQGRLNPMRGLEEHDQPGLILELGEPPFAVIRPTRRKPHKQDLLALQT